MGLIQPSELLQLESGFISYSSVSVPYVLLMDERYPGMTPVICASLGSNQSCWIKAAGGALHAYPLLHHTGERTPLVKPTSCTW